LFLISIQWKSRLHLFYFLPLSFSSSFFFCCYFRFARFHSLRLNIAAHCYFILNLLK
jgi:hypothetical protein